MSKNKEEVQRFLATTKIKVDGQEFETQAGKPFFMKESKSGYFQVVAINIYMGEKGKEVFVTSIPVINLVKK